MQASLRLENSKDQADDSLRLLVRIALVIAVGPPDVAHRRMMQEVTALGLVPHALQQAACEDMPLRFAHHATESQQEAIVVVGWILEAIGIGQQRPEDCTECKPLRPVFV
jgi:hypothetical protein